MELDANEFDSLMKTELLSIDFSPEELSALTISPRIVGAKYKRRPEPLTLPQTLEPLTLSPQCKPPVTVSKNDLKTLAYDQNTPAKLNSVLYIAAPPPLEVRTRTKNENRTFSCTVGVHPDVTIARDTMVKVRLCYARDTSHTLDILGGELLRPIAQDGSVDFDDLSVSVASHKHGEREFMLCFSLATLVPGRDCEVYSTPFYAYSHKSVLTRRRELTLRALSEDNGSTQGGLAMHVVGSPFVKSERLQVVFRVLLRDFQRYCGSECARLGLSEDESEEQWVSIPGDNLDYFSDSVLFFETPNTFSQCVNEKINAFVQVTNDGRNFSNPLPFIFDGTQEEVSATSPSKKLCLLSRI